MTTPSEREHILLHNDVPDMLGKCAEPERVSRWDNIDPIKILVAVIVFSFLLLIALCGIAAIIFAKGGA